MAAKTNEEMVDKVQVDPVTGNTTGFFSKLRGNVNPKLAPTDSVRPQGGNGTNPL
jgi:hypothetical protein